MHNVDLAEPVKSKPDYRTAQRVKVNMPVTILLSKGQIYYGRTVDFSEAGILICDYNGPTLQPNRLIGVGIRGIISDKNDDNDSKHFLMRVVRHNGNEFAVKFCRSHDMTLVAEKIHHNNGRMKDFDVILKDTL